MSTNDSFGLGKGKIYPARAASHLLNPLRFLVQPPRRVIRQMGLSPDHQVLEVGCGPGWFSKVLAAAVPQGHLTICDLQQGMLEIASVRLNSFGNFTAVQSDASSMPFGDGQFDAILLSSVLGELPDKNRCLEECARVLSPSGKVTIVETRRDSDFIPQQELIHLAQNAGLEFFSRSGTRWEYTVNFRHASGR